MVPTIHQVTLADQFKDCPLCGYSDGFHSMLQRDGEEIRWLFICPACHEIFDLGRLLPR